MTPRNRVLRSLHFEPVDRIPVVGGFVRHPEFLAASAGVTIEHFWSSPRETAIAALRNQGADVILALILPNKDSVTGSQVEQYHQTEFRTPEDIRDYVATLPEPADSPKRVTRWGSPPNPAMFSLTHLRARI